MALNSDVLLIIFSFSDPISQRRLNIANRYFHNIFKHRVHSSVSFNCDNSISLKKFLSAQEDRPLSFQNNIEYAKFSSGLYGECETLIRNLLTFPNLKTLELLPCGHREPDSNTFNFEKFYKIIGMICENKSENLKTVVLSNPILFECFWVAYRMLKKCQLDVYCISPKPEASPHLYKYTVVPKMILAARIFRIPTREMFSVIPERCLIELDIDKFTYLTLGPLTRGVIEELSLTNRLFSLEFGVEELTVTGNLAVCRLLEYENIKQSIRRISFSPSSDGNRFPNVNRFAIRESENDMSMIPLSRILISTRQWSMVEYWTSGTDWMSLKNEMETSKIRFARQNLRIVLSDRAEFSLEDAKKSLSFTARMRCHINKLEVVYESRREMFRTDELDIIREYGKGVENDLAVKGMLFGYCESEIQPRRMWVFGYGSLIWKIDFPYSIRIPVYIKGFGRRFWQGSNDHRGTPEGRVATLISYEDWTQFSDFDPHKLSPEIICWGLAIRIPDSKVEEVVKHLDHREKNGYTAYTTDVYNPEISKFIHTQLETNTADIPIIRNVTVYVATTANESLLGPFDVPKSEVTPEQLQVGSIDTIAKTIAVRSGPSGKNSDYLLGLCDALRVIAPHHEDSHLDALEKKVRLLTHQPETDGDKLEDHGSIKKEYLIDLKLFMETDPKEWASLILQDQKLGN
ncbi:hypothetical protein HK098_002957 [Nowakowskiella sp. JEL0407]|nr:hypothetical protein HK098_002957 [Nowakowskiella sp. JEL0407]